MSTKSLLRKDKSGELSRLLTVERLKAARVATAPTGAGFRDPDLKALLDCARSADTPARSRGSRINRQVVKKLAGL